MPAPKFLSGLPKPVLFGLYGALGGLIGAVLFGEPAWYVLKPPAPLPVPQLAVGASATVTLYPGSENAFVVRVARDHFDGPVAVKFEKLPPGVTIPSITIPADKSEGEAKVNAAAGTATGTTNVTIAAAADGTALTASSQINVEVVAPPPPPPALAVAVPANLTLYARGVGKFTVTVARRRYDGPITVSVAPLPAGVTAAPATIPAGKNEVEVALTADATAKLVSTPLTVTVEAPGVKKDTAQTAVAVQKPPIAPVDVVFVLDVTASMQWAIDDLKNGIGKFADALAKQQIDFRLALVTFQDITEPGETVEVIQFKNGDKDEPFTNNATAFRDKVALLKAQGGGDIPESSLEGLTAASKLPFRQKASKMMLLITDAPPKVVGGRVEDAVERTAKVLKDAATDSIHIVVLPLDKADYKPLLEAGADKMGGKFFDLGDVVRGEEGFDGLLDTFSRVVTAAAIAKSPDARPTVAAAAAPPRVASAAAEAPKGAAAPDAPSVKGVQSSAKFAAGTEGRLTLAIAVWTGCIAGLVCLALLAGQHHYLRGALPAVGGAAAGLLGGLVVGLVGGAAGQGLFFLAPDSATLAHIFRVFGWAILGGLAGVGLSLFIPNMKWSLGLAGGAVGGAAGALGYILVSEFTGDWLGRIVGGLVLGFCIGLMVAVAEAAFRRAWLEVRYGGRETVTVTLGPEPVKVGSDAKACTVWARGAPPVAVRYFVRDGQVVCDDPIMGRESAVADGFAKEVGNVTVTVRTGSSVAPPAPPPSRPVPPPRPTAKKPAMTLDDDDGFDLPMPVASSSRPAMPPIPPPKPAAAPPPAAPKPPVPSKPAMPAVGSKPTLPAMPPKPPVPSKPAMPPVGSMPPKPPVPSKPAMPPVAPPPAAPAIKPTARDPNACPSCGRVVAGKPGTRYCMMCDQTY